MKRLIIMMGAAVMIAPLMLSADDYQFIISGDPVAAATVICLMFIFLLSFSLLGC